MANKVNLNVDPSFRMVKTTEYTPEIQAYEDERVRRVADLDPGVVPIQMDFELNTDCNLRCPQCPQSTHKIKAMVMKKELFTRLLDEVVPKGMQAMKLQYRGEPLLVDDIHHAILHAKSKGVLKVFMNTNATLLTFEKAQQLINAGLDKIICSVDSTWPHIYESIRIGAKFRDVYQNIQGLKFLKEYCGLKYPVIRVQVVKQKKNKKEIESGKYEKFWGHFADEIGIEDQFNFKDGEKDLTELPNWRCGQLWQRLVVLSEGVILPCCAAINWTTDKVYAVGDATTQSIEEIWNSDKLKEFRDLHASGRSHEVEMCQHCRLRKNVIKQLWEVKNDEPD